jgi:N-acetylglucosamine malate deacetylase 2
MSGEPAHPTRKDFLLAMAGAAFLPQAVSAQAHAQSGAQSIARSVAQSRPGKLLIVVAHPDDEYACAATTYRMVRELGWTADQVIVTNGESGYRYASLAEIFYGASLTYDGDDRARLAGIRKQEAIRAGKILGIRQHYFLDQKDLGFDTDASSAGTANWDRARVRGLLDDLLSRERYDAVFTLLPTAETHGHHRAATLLALEAVAAMLEDIRPLILGVEARSKSEGPTTFRGTEPLLVFDRTRSFGFRSALNYQIVVNWVIAEHKSQGLFQTEYGKSDSEQFWLFEASGPDAVQRAQCGPLGVLL